MFSSVMRALTAKVLEGALEFVWRFSNICRSPNWLDKRVLR